MDTSIFIPLKTEYYEAFRSGEKRDELRRYGGRWHEVNCYRGRSVLLSCGYGKQRRMSGIITGFEKQRGETFGSIYRGQIEKVFGRLDIDIACVGIQVTCDHGCKWRRRETAICGCCDWLSKFEPNMAVTCGVSSSGSLLG